MNKEAGLSVHNGEGSENLLQIVEGMGVAQKVFPIHRLDKETSGVQLLALSSESARKYSQAFAQRSVQKIYLGIMRGQIIPPEGVWAQPLTDKAEGRKNPAGLTKERIPCETAYRVLQLNPYFSLCELDLLTGRQHQIRKHSALSRHPIVGDDRYGDKKDNDNIARRYQTKRMFLHCSRIVIGGQTYSCSTPASFADLLEVKTG